MFMWWSIYISKQESNILALRTKSSCVYECVSGSIKVSYENLRVKTPASSLFEDVQLCVKVTNRIVPCWELCTNRRIYREHTTNGGINRGENRDDWWCDSVLRWNRKQKWQTIDRGGSVSLCRERDILIAEVEAIPIRTLMKACATEGIAESASSFCDTASVWLTISLF